MTTDELIAALEKATGPDRALDEAIDRVLRPTTWEKRDAYNLPSSANWGWDFPHYTAGIDAALALVPESSFVRLSVAPRDKQKLAVAYVTANDVNHQGGGDTPALALCIAALKARAVKESTP